MNDHPEDPGANAQDQPNGADGPFKIVQLVQAKGGSTVRDVVQQAFVGDYERLRDAYIHPSAVFERVQLENFTGREWLLEEIDRFLKDHERGYFILEAEAGLGKTTFLASLVRTRGYIHHFSELAPGLDNVGASIKNLAAQLVLGYHLGAWEAEGVLPGAAARPDFLYHILELAAQERSEGEKIVIVVDALDEAGTPYNLNVLGLPESLPEGVYLIVSQRPVPVALQIDTAKTPRRALVLSAGSSENLADMRRFLESAAARPGVADYIRASGGNEREFIALLLKKCRGLWIYLHFLIPEIERGERSSFAFAALPDGLTQYYAKFWSHWRDEDRELWHRSFLPLLTSMAAAAEPVTVERMVSWRSAGEGFSIQEPLAQRLLNEDWRPFINPTGDEGEKSYRFYHATVREFFAGGGDRGGLSSGEIALLAELAEATRAAHGAIADYYLSSWGGLEENLPGLQEPGRRDLHAGYGLRYLAAHLQAAGREADLHRLLRLERWKEHQVLANPTGWRGWWSRLRGRKQYRTERVYENAWYAAKEASGDVEGYLADLTRARSAVDAAFKDAESAERGEWVGLQCRYALITASINSLAQNIPISLLLRLVDSDLWSPEQGLAIARRTPDASQRAEALTRLAAYFPDRERSELLNQALSTAQGITDEPERARTLAWLAPHLPESQRERALQRALSAAEGIRSVYDRALVLAEIAPRLPEPDRTALLREALSTIQGISDEHARPQALIGAAHLLPKSEREQVLREALDPVQHNNETEDERARALAALGPHLPEALLREALSTAQQLDSDYNQESALVGLLPRLAELGHPQEALSIAQGIRHGSLANALVGLAPYLPEAELREALSTAERQISTQEIHFESDWDWVQSRLAVRLAELGHPREALSIAKGIKEEHARPEALAGVAEHLPESEREQALKDALHAAKELSAPEEERDEMLAWLLPIMAELGQPREALSNARQIGDAENRVQALAGMAPYLPETHLPEALSAARQIWDDYAREEALANLLPRLAAEGHPREALSHARQIAFDDLQAWALANLAPHLPLPLLPDALFLAQRIRVGTSRVNALTGLIPHLPEPERSKVLRQALSAVRWFSYAPHRAWALAGLAPYLKESKREGALRKALSAARREGYFDDREQALAILAPRLPEALLRKALSIAQRIKDEHELAPILTGLAPHLPEDLLREALSITQGIEYEAYKAQALAGLLARLAELGHFQEALSTAQGIDSEGPRAQAQAGLAPYLPEAALHEILHSVPQIKEGDDQAQALVRLAPHLPETWLPEALSIAQGIQYEAAQSRALAGLAPRLAELGQIQEALTTIQGIWLEPARKEALAELARRLSQLSPAELGDTWPVFTEDLSNRARRNTLFTLGALGPVLGALGGGEALLETTQAIQDAGRWWP